MNRVWIVLAALTGLLVAGTAGGAPGPDKKIGILMFSGEMRYQEAMQGFVDELAKAGFSEPRVSFLRENAGANKGKARDVVQKFAAADLDLIFTLGTSATIAVAREIKNVPIVFSVVYDPVDAGVARDWNSSGNNTTGVSSRIPMTKLMDTLLEFIPVKRLAVLYTPGEKNSETQLRDLQDLERHYRIRVVPVPLTTREEISQILPEIVRTSEAVYLSGSNLVDSQVELIVRVATQARVATISHLEDLVEKGVLLGVCFDPYRLGSVAGKKAVRILKGASPSSIPIETYPSIHLILNNGTAKTGKFEVAPSFRKLVTRVVE